jgi:hypothetical protein
MKPQFHPFADDIAIESILHALSDPAGAQIERMTPDRVQRSLGVPVQHVPTYLALTEGRKHGLASSDGAQPTLTTREARRLVELHGAYQAKGGHRSLKTDLPGVPCADFQPSFRDMGGTPCDFSLGLSFTHVTESIVS